jgi:hypothetical protein
VVPNQACKLFLVILMIGLISACTVAKLEARLEANPQCKDVVNPKTGALMPCPGTDRSFYRSAGLEQAVAATPSVQPESVAKNTSSINVAPASKSIDKSPSMQPDCKPQIHKKSGSMIPCLPADQ